MPRLLSLLATIALLAGLSLCTVLPEVANITGITLMVVGLLLCCAGPGSREIATRRPFFLVYAAGAILLLALIPTATGVESIAAIFILVPLWLAGPYAALLAKAPAPLLSPMGLGLMALIGTAGAAAVAGYDVYVLQLGRGGYSVNNPIHLADLAVSLGFFALIGLFSPSRWRFVVLLGPVLALAAVLLSGSRGPLIAFGVLSVLSAIFYVAVVWRPSRAVALGLGMGLACLVIAAPFVTVDLAGRQFRLADVAQQVATGSADDGSTSERLFMLRSAWGAFQASPIYGHGMIDYPVEAARYAPADNPFAPSGHLHNDLADFAVIGGLLGLLSYALIILAPVIGGLRARRPEVLFIGLLASAGYLVMGLTNAMLGILTQTVLFGLMLALVGLLAGGKRT